MEFRADYTIPAKPTPYSGVAFRSRLEARWAAFFDLCGWGWAYEPPRLPGWLPDFRIRTAACDLLAEVKPIDLAQAWKSREGGHDVGLPDYDKARQYGGDFPILLLGDAPTCLSDDDIVGVLVIKIERALSIAGCTLDELNASLRVKGHAASKWAEAERIVDGLPPSQHNIFPEF